MKNVFFKYMFIYIHTHTKNKESIHTVSRMYVNITSVFILMEATVLSPCVSPEVQNMNPLGASGLFSP